MLEKYLADSGAPADFSAVRGRHLLIALSGGADSVALAAMLAAERERLALTLSAAHLDHGIRPESADDARWCGALCERLGIPFNCLRADIPAEAARTGEGLETVARRVRHRWLRQVREDIGADYIALAHHMDDQAETVLMHLARGAGPEGIGGMAPFSGELYRPLLGLRKRQLEDYLRQRHLTWREDATNAVDDTPRNALRLHGIPELEKSYPQFVPAAARYAQSARIESDYVAAQAAAWMEGRVEAFPGGQLLRLEDGVHPALLRRAIRRICGEIGWERLNAVEALAGVPRGRTEISGGLLAERGRLGLYFLRREPPAMRAVPLNPEGKTCLPGLCEIVATPSAPVPVRNDPLLQVLDADALAGAELRTRRDGDRMRPLGGGDRLLSDVLTDKKVDRPLRDRVALVARGNRVLWACGLGIAQEAGLTGETRRAVALACRYAYDARLLKNK